MKFIFYTHISYTGKHKSLLKLAFCFLTNPGDAKDMAGGDTASGDTPPGLKKNLATRMVTRLRNPESKLSQLKNQQVAAAIHEANKGFKEGREVSDCECEIPLVVATVVFTLVSSHF